MKLIWQPLALDDLKSIQRFIALENPGAANRIVKTIATSVNEQLTTFPNTGRTGRIEGTRELIIPKTPFIVPYAIRENTIYILGVHHSSRRWPEQF